MKRNTKEMASSSCPGLGTEKRLLLDFLGTQKAGTLREAVTRNVLGFSWLSSLTFRSANAVDPGGWSFAEAYCDVQNNSDPMYVGSFFHTAMTMLRDYTRNKSLPETEQGIRLLYRLIHFLVDEDNQQILQSYVSSESNASVCPVLANHLFSKLCLHQTFLISQQIQSQDHCSCPCGCNDSLRNKFADTSIGNEAVWHGCMDIVLHGCSVHCAGLPGTTRSGPQSTARSLCQFISQCVVFSFYQKKNRPELKNFLIPSIGVHGNDLLFYLYDSENDILLSSSALRLLTKDRQSVDTSAVLWVWLMVNAQLLGTGLPDYADPIPKANFFVIAEPKLDLYRNSLRFGGVKNRRKRKLTENQNCSPGPEDFKMDQKYKKFKDEIIALQFEL